MKTFKFIAALCGVAAFVCSCEKEDSKTNKVASITLSATELKLAPEEEAVLTATFAPEDADLSSVVWASSAETIATVSPEGKVKAVAEGETTVSVTAGDVKSRVQGSRREENRMGSRRLLRGRQCKRCRSMG